MDTVKSQTKTFKVDNKITLESTPKQEQTVRMRTKKAEQGAKLAELEENFRATIIHMTEEENELLESHLKDERIQMQRDHELARRQLNEFQLFRQENVREKHAKEIAKLYQDIDTYLQAGTDFDHAEQARIAVEMQRGVALREDQVAEIALLQAAAAPILPFR